MGARIDAVDPLAVLDHGKAAAPGRASRTLGPVTAPDGTVAVPAPLQGTVVAFLVAGGDLVHTGQPLLVMEAMKMEHVVVAPGGGRVLRWLAAEGDAIAEGYPLAFLEPLDVAVPEEAGGAGRISTGSGPTSVRCSTATPSASTPPGRTWWPAAGRPGSARRGRTSRTSATRGRSSSTARWSSPRSAVADRSTT